MTDDIGRNVACPCGSGSKGFLDEYLAENLDGTNKGAGSPTSSH